MTQQLQRVEEKIDKIREQDFFAAVKHIKTAFDHCKKCNSETKEEHKNAAQEHFKLALEKVYSGYSPLSFKKKIDITKLGIVASIGCQTLSVMKVTVTRLIVDLLTDPVVIKEKTRWHRFP